MIFCTQFHSNYSKTPPLGALGGGLVDTSNNRRWEEVGPPPPPPPSEAPPPPRWSWWDGVDGDGKALGRPPSSAVAFSANTFSADKAGHKKEDEDENGGPQWKKEVEEGEEHGHHRDKMVVVKDDFQYGLKPTYRQA